MSHRDLLYISGRKQIFVLDDSQVDDSRDDSQVDDCRDGTYSIIATLQGHTSRVTSMYSDHDQKVLYSCSNDGTVRLWNDQNVCIRTVDVGCSIKKLIKVKDRLYGCFGTSGNGVGIWNSDMKRVRTLLDSSDLMVIDDALCTDGELIYAALHDRTGLCNSVRVWNSDHLQVDEFTGFAVGESSLVAYNDMIVLSSCDDGMRVFKEV